MFTNEEYKQAQQKLFASCPILFGGEQANRTILQVGLEHGPGWFPIIETLCIKLEALAETLEEDDRPHVVQIKEKFGGLRFYFENDLHGIDERFRHFVKHAYNQCAVACELCGKPGTLRRNPWIRVLCDADQKRELAKQRRQ